MIAFVTVDHASVAVRLGVVVALTVGVAVVPTRSSQAAAASIWESPFEIDGNTGVSTAGNVDWENAPGLNILNDTNYTGDPGVVVDPAGVGCNQTPEDIYLNNSKVDDVPQRGTTGQAPDKTDLCQVYIASEFRLTNASTATTPEHPGGLDSYLYLGWHRRTNTGAAIIWWELNQGTATDINGFTARSQNDLLIGFDFQSSPAVLYYSKWDATTAAWNLPATVPTSIGAYSDFVQAAVSPNTNFGELAINLSQLIPGCGTFLSSATFSQTGSISAFHNSALQDYLGPRPLDPPVTTCPSLQLEKIPDATPIDAGTTAGFTITVTNTGDVSARGLEVTDLLPADLGLDWAISAGQPTGTASVLPACSIDGAVGSQTLTCGTSTTFPGQPPLGATAVDWGYILHPGESFSVHVESETVWDTAADSPIDNVARLSAWNAEVLSAGASIDVLAADVAVTKSDGVDTYTPGLPTTYTIVVSNSGPSDAYDIAVTDQLPPLLDAGTAVWTCVPSTGSVCDDNAGTGDIASTVDLLNGGTATFTLTARALSSATGDLVNTVTALSGSEATLPVDDPRRDDNTAVDIDAPVPVSDLSIVKTDESATFVPGSPITYTLTVTNLGPSDVLGATVVDSIPAGITSWAWECVTCSPTSGTGALSTQVDLAADETAVVTVVAQTDSSLFETIVNTATVSEPPGVTDPNQTNNTSTDESLAALEADLWVSKTDGSGTYVPGTTVTYTILVGNDGPVAVAGASVTDAVPAGVTSMSWVCTPGIGADCDSTVTGDVAGDGAIALDNVDIESGASIELIVLAAIDPSWRGELVNVVSVSNPDGLSDPDSSNNVATDTDLADPQPNLSIVKSATATTVLAGESVTFDLEVFSNGPSTAFGVTLTDATPDGLSTADATIGGVDGGACVVSGAAVQCDFGSMPPGSTRSVTISYPVPADYLVVGGTSPLVNIAGVDSDETEPTEDEAQVDVVASADLSVTKTDGSDTYVPGGPITYTITIANAGPSDVVGALVNDDVPSDITQVTWTCTGGGAATCSAESGSGDIIDFPVDLPSGSAATIVVSGIVRPFAPVHALSNSVSVTPPADVDDPDISNNVATDESDGLLVTDLVIDKDGPSTYTPGQLVIYTVTVTNQGPSDAAGAVVTDSVPLDVVEVTWSCSAAGGATCSPATGSGNSVIVGADVPVGGSVTLLIQGSAAPTAIADPLVNSASVQQSDDADLSNNTDTVSSVLGPVAVLPPGAVTVAGTVWFDVDRDGRGVGSEPGIASVVVALVNQSGQVLATGTTDGNGRYSIVCPCAEADYSIRIDRSTVSARFDVQTFESDGTLDGTVTVRLAPGTASSDVDFGYWGSTPTLPTTGSAGTASLLVTGMSLLMFGSLLFVLATTRKRRLS